MKKTLILDSLTKWQKNTAKFPEALNPQILLHSTTPGLEKDPKGNSAATLEEFIFKTVN